MSRLNRALVFVAVCLVAVAVLPAQQAAPREITSAQVGGGKVSVEYGRPALKGRNVADLLKGLPEDRMWRAGSEQITTLTTEVPIMLGSTTVPPGKYSVYVHCPQDGPYSLVLNKVLGQPLKDIYAAAPPQLANEPWPHMNYTAQIGNQEAARVAMKNTKSSAPVDLFTIALKPAAGGASLQLDWGTEVWTVDLMPGGNAARPSEGSDRR